MSKKQKHDIATRFALVQNQLAKLLHEAYPAVEPADCTGISFRHVANASDEGRRWQETLRSYQKAPWE